MARSSWLPSSELPPQSRRRMTWMVRAAAGADLAAGAALVLAANHVIDGQAWVQLLSGGMAAALAVTILGSAALRAADLAQPQPQPVRTRLTRPAR
jgi:hypothetical protein